MEAAAATDTSLGFGWSHSYGTFLFRQQSMLFRRGPSGMVAKFNRVPGTSPVQYRPMNGYFETMVGYPDGSFTIFYKEGSTETFRAIANCPYFYKSPIYQLTECVDRNGATNVLTYDASGRLSRITDSYGRQIAFTYNAWNTIKTVTDPLGRVTRFDYAESGSKLVRITDPLGQRVQYDYDGSYRVIRKTDKVGGVYFYTYGAGTIAGELIRTSGTNVTQIPLASLANTNRWAFDQSALTASFTAVYIPSSVTNTDPRGGQWLRAYDTNGNVTAVIAPDGATKSSTYDPATLKKTSTTDANGTAISES